MSQCYIFCTYTLKAYIAAIQNRFIRNNSSKLEPIGPKLYTETSIHLQTSIGALHQMGAKWQHKNIFQKLFCDQNNASFHPPPGGHFLEIWNTKHEWVLSWIWHRIAKFLRQGITYPQNFNFEVFSAHYWCAHSSLEWFFHMTYCFQDIGMQ